MRLAALLVLLGFMSTVAVAAEDGKSIVVDKSKFSDIYPAVWFSPSTGELSPLKDKSEKPPAEQYEIWIEPHDPEFAFIPNGTHEVGFAALGGSSEVFTNAEIPDRPKLSRTLTELLKQTSGPGPHVFYCKGATCSCLIMITASDPEAGVMRFQWKLLAKNR